MTRGAGDGHAQPDDGAAPATHGDPATGRSPLAAVVTSGIAYALFYGSVGAWQPYWPVYFTGLGVALGAIGLLTAIPAAVQIVAAPIWGALADRIGDVRGLLVVAAAMAVAVSLAIAGGLPVALLFPGVALLAIGVSAWPPLIDARTVVELGRQRDRYGQARLFGSAGFVVVALAVGVLVQANGAHVLFGAYLPLLVLAGAWPLVAFGRSGRPGQHTGSGPAGALRLLRVPTYAILLTGSMLAWSAYMGASAFLSLRLVDQGGGAELVGVGWALNALVEIPVMLAFRPLSRRFGAPALIVVGATLLAVRNVGWALSGSALATVGVAMLSGVAYGLFLVGVTTWLADRVHPSMRATAQALFVSTAFAAGTIVGSLVAGWIVAVSGLASMFVGTAVLALVGAGLLWQAVGRPGLRGRAA